MEQPYNKPDSFTGWKNFRLAFSEKLDSHIVHKLSKTVHFLLYIYIYNIQSASEDWMWIILL